MMIYYAPTFLSGVGFGKESALLASLGVAIVYAVMTLLGCLFVDRIGRRRLMLVMIPGSVVSLIGLGIMFASGAHGGWQGWLTIGFLLAFMLFNSGGIQVCGDAVGQQPDRHGDRAVAGPCDRAGLDDVGLCRGQSGVVRVRAVLRARDGGREP
jgi:nitrate/nitrite transporter NarK